MSRARHLLFEETPPIIPPLVYASSGHQSSSTSRFNVGRQQHSFYPQPALDQVPPASIAYLEQVPDPRSSVQFLETSSFAGNQAQSFLTAYDLSFPTSHTSRTTIAHPQYQRGPYPPISQHHQPITVTTVYDTQDLLSQYSQSDHTYIPPRSRLPMRSVSDPFDVPTATFQTQHESPPPFLHKVFRLSCRSCGLFFSNRGMRVSHFSCITL